MLRFLADESCDSTVVRALTSLGHEVLSVAELSPRVDDETVIGLALREECVLLTEDKDFSVRTAADHGGAPERPVADHRQQVGGMGRARVSDQVSTPCPTLGSWSYRAASAGGSARRMASSSASDNSSTASARRPWCFRRSYSSADMITSRPRPLWAPRLLFPTRPDVRPVCRLPVLFP